MSLTGTLQAGEAGREVAATATATPLSTSAPLSFENGVPAVLSSADAQRYRQIFALQEDAKWKAADKLIAELQDDRLLGHILEQRYMHPTGYRSRYKELKDWLAHYADHPGADRIYRLALMRRPANYKYPRKPQAERIANAAPHFYRYVTPKKRSAGDNRKVRQIKRQIRRNVLRTRLTVTEELLASKKVKRLLDQVEIDEGYARVAAGWFYYGKIEKAFALADKAARRSGPHVADAYWIAGLAAWRLGDHETAAWHFERLGRHNHASEWLTSAGAYWAARAHLKSRHPEEVSANLRRAAAAPRTFYGQLAAAALGIKPSLDFGSTAFDPELVVHVEARPSGRRALALLQVGDRRRAERELVQFGSLEEPEDVEALLILAEQAGMPNLALKVGNWLHYGEEGPSEDAAKDAALYPLPPWQPEGGFGLDRALIFAVIRQESAFKPTAKSPDGARGLMQLMPQTANYLAPGKGYHRRAHRDRLFEPGVNLALGQQYLTYLLDKDIVGGDLFRLATAYNGGPGNLVKWERQAKAGDDPLLFIESLPSRETRIFIERVLANLWIYRQRLKQGTPTLEAVASGAPPLYHAQDVKRSEVARNGAN